MSPQHIFLFRPQAILATESESENSVELICRLTTSLGQQAIGTAEFVLGVSQECSTVGEQDVERLGHYFVTPQALAHSLWTYIAVVSNVVMFWNLQELTILSSFQMCFIRLVGHPRISAVVS